MLELLYETAKPIEKIARRSVCRVRLRNARRRLRVRGRRLIGALAEIARRKQRKKRDAHDELVHRARGPALGAQEDRLILHNERVEHSRARGVSAAQNLAHLGLQRDEHTAIASRYYTKLPADLSNSVALVVDPMLATGGSAIAAIALLQKAGARDIRLLCIVAAPEGIAAVEGAHPAVEIFTPVIDRELNAQKFILPGLGDFGDRLYGTV